MKFLFFPLLFIITTLYGSSSYSVALVNMGMSYAERDASGAFLDSEKSNNIFGYELGYDFDTGCEDTICSKLALKFLAMNGYSDYKGSYLQNNQVANLATANTIYDLSADYIITKSFSHFEFLFGAGFGYHSWYREFSSVQNEIYGWFYLTPIVGINANVTNNLELGITLKYKYGINPTMEANSINGTFYLGSANTFECIIPLQYSITKKIDVFTNFIFSKQSIEKSNYLSGYVDGTYYTTIHEPASSDYQHFVKVGITIKY